GVIIAGGRGIRTRVAEDHVVIGRRLVEAVEMGRGKAELIRVSRLDARPDAERERRGEARAAYPSRRPVDVDLSAALRIGIYREVGQALTHRRGGIDRALPVATKLELAHAATAGEPRRLVVVAAVGVG